MGRISGQENPAGTVAVGMPGGRIPPGEPAWRARRHRDAADPLGRGPELGDADRSIDVAGLDAELSGAEAKNGFSRRRDGYEASLVLGDAEAAEQRVARLDLEVTGDSAERDVDPWETDPGQLTHCAAGAVT